MPPKSSSVPTKTFSNFSFLLTSKRFIKLREKKLLASQKGSSINISLPRPTIHLSERPVEGESCNSEEMSPRRRLIHETLKKAVKKEPTINQRLSKIRTNYSPRASASGLSSGLGDQNKGKEKKKSKSVIPTEILPLNLEKLKTLPNKKTRRLAKNLQINVDSIEGFHLNTESNSEEIESGISPAGSPQNKEKPQNEENNNSESAQENSAYLESSYREIKKKHLRSKPIRFNLLTQEKEKQTHDEIKKILTKINGSDIFRFEGLDNKNLRIIHEVRENKMAHNRAFGLKTINEIINPDKRLLHENINFNFIESKANRFNIKNKRITLQSLLTKTEWENEKNGFLPFIEDKTGRKFEADLPKSNRNHTKREFYSKWYLPVNCWNIEKPVIKKNILDTPLKSGFYLNFILLARVCPSF